MSELIAWFTDPANWSGPNGIPVRTLQTLWISAAAMVIAVALAFPIGMIIGHFGRFGGLVTNLGTIGRAIPTFALLIIFASWDVIGVGNLAAILALAIFAIPPLLTNTYVGVRDVDEAMVDGATGMGMTDRQVLGRVELPTAVPLIGAGLRTTTVQVVATATLAALVGGGGLGRYVVDGFALQDLTLMFAGVICVSVLSVGTEAVLAVIQKYLTPLPLRAKKKSDAQTGSQT
ncbi:MAG: ABC transporter permease [Candidatus Nanopelagicales bacterium]